MTKVKHAPYALLGDLTIVYAKTTKTACNRRVLTEKLVSRDDTDCPDCQEQIRLDRAELAEMKQTYNDLVEQGLINGPKVE